MVRFANRVRVYSATQGTGPIVLGAAIPSFQTPGQAGVNDGDTVRYIIEDGDQWEIGLGVYSTSGSITLTRSPTESSNAGQQLNLSGSASVFLGATAEDFNEVNAAVTDIQIPLLQMATAFTNSQERFVSEHAFEGV